MIGYFPDPYPDELFYSLCARYSERMQYPSKTAVNQELFGLMRANASIDLPGHLDFFAAALPPDHSCGQVKRLIERHTLWPFYRPFLSIERQQAVLAAMRGVAGYRPDLHAGTAGSEIPRPEWLRFCPKCVEEDRRRLGECYWHRTHQVPGVYLCPTHEILLENSSTGVGWRWSSIEFTPAETVLHSTSWRELPLSHPWHKLLLYLSREAAWLLDQPTLDANQVAVRKRYKIVLAEQGLASYTGLVKTQQLLQAFADFYPADLLAWLHCPLDSPVKTAVFSIPYVTCYSCTSWDIPAKHFLNSPLNLSPLARGPGLVSIPFVRIISNRLLRPITWSDANTPDLWARSAVSVAINTGARGQTVRQMTACGGSV